MEKLVIDGGTPLHGEIPISGAKNAALPIMAATLLGSGSFRLTNVPDLNDIHTMRQLLETLGADSSYDDGNLELDTREVDRTEAPYELVKKMRASVLVLGPLLARFSEANVSLPGGCAIGTRPIDLHLSGLEELGVSVKLSHGIIQARVEEMSGGEIYLDFPSVGATENIMMAASRARGTTVIENAACEPEIADLARMINEMGGEVRGAGTDRVEIQGVEQLSGVQHEVIPDRIETGTYLIAGAITGGSVTVKRTEPSYLQSVLNKLRHTGVNLDVDAEGRITLESVGRPRPVDIVTMPYPGFPTDMQAQFMALMSLAEGNSTIRETIFEDRFTHVLELERLGADIKIDGNTVSIRGVESLDGAPVMATDLRASAALVLAGLAARDTTEVRRIYHLDRGYENLTEKLRSLGASVRRDTVEVKS